MSMFEAFNIKSIPHTEKYDADILENVASNLSPSDDFTHDTFSVELIYGSSIPENITTWKIFDDDQQIIYFLHSKDTFKVLVNDDKQHEVLLQDSTLEDKLEFNNPIPKNIFGMETYFKL